MSMNSFFSGKWKVQSGKCDVKSKVILLFATLSRFLSLSLSTKIVENVGVEPTTFPM